MDVYLCEKPSQGRDLARVLGYSQRGRGSLHNGTHHVTWAVGHALEMLDPNEYRDEWKSWTYEHLPIIPDEWKFKVKKEVKDQYDAIMALLKKADRVFIATDFDREGEAIARQLLDRARFKGDIQRVKLRALDDRSIRKALDDICSGEETLPLYYAQTARQRADWLVGMNLTRLFTKLGREMGSQEVINVGRVQTPMITLVCERDAEIANFKAKPFYVLKAEVAVQHGTFSAKWVPPEDMVDEQGHVLNKAFVEQVRLQITGKGGQIAKAETKDGSESAPLPFDLTSLQQYCANRWGYTADQVLKAAQGLYETHKATSYPRTDSRYLPVSQFDEVPDVMQALIRTDDAISGLVAGADTSMRGRAFNDAKVSAHHAIIPTTQVVDMAKMSEVERNVYDAVRRHWIAQFYSAFTFDKTVIEVTCGKHTLEARGKVPKVEGWRILFSGVEDAGKDDTGKDDEKDEEQALLPPVQPGELASIRDSKLLEKMTRPPPRFTEATLLSAMENVARFVQEPKFKQILKETAGLGTPATRAATIKAAVDRQFLVRKKKVLESTPKARAMVAIVPSIVKSPAMTALWEQQMEKIAAGEMSMEEFYTYITQWIDKLVTQVIANRAALTQADGDLAKAFKKLAGPTFDCYTCGSEMRRFKSKKGHFWKCQSETCRATFDDERGKPKKRAPRPPAIEQPANAPTCGECGSAMRLRQSKAKPGAARKDANRYFWGCSGYPNCKATAPYEAAGADKTTT